MNEYYSSFFGSARNKDLERYMRKYLGTLGLSYDRISCAEPDTDHLDAEHCVDKNMAMERLRQEIGECVKCPLHSTRTKLVFGIGDPCSNTMFIGEAPGEEEDMKGEPFVGRAGRLLDKALESVGLSRKENVYIANVLKSRPPGNDISACPEAIPACFPYLKKQIAIVAPKIICCLGATAAHTLLDIKAPITKIRGRFYEYEGIRVMVTFHPSYLLRNPIAKREVWDDLKKIKKMLVALQEDSNVQDSSHNPQ